MPMAVLVDVEGKVLLRWRPKRQLSSPWLESIRTSARSGQQRKKVSIDNTREG
jgi:hypothetical protein